MLDQLNEVCLQLNRQALTSLGDEVEAALKKEDGVTVGTNLIYAAIESLGLKPVVPVAEDAVSTSSGGPSDEGSPPASPAKEEPEVVAERLRIQEEKARAAEERKKAEELAKEE